ncbi:hypothetical protein NKH77_30525 [Streptomyces sp. M19]
MPPPKSYTSQKPRRAPPPARAVRPRGGRRLVQQRRELQPRQRGGAARRVALVEFEGGGHGDHGRRDVLVQGVRGIPPQRQQYLRRQLLGRQLAARRRERAPRGAHAHLELELPVGVGRVRLGAVPRPLADVHVSGRADVHDRRRVLLRCRFRRTAASAPVDTATALFVVPKSTPMSTVSRAMDPAPS